jgi:hypothetical protein
LIGVDLMMFESEKARFDEILRKLSNMNLLKMPKLELFKHEARSSANSITKEILMLKLSQMILQLQKLIKTQMQLLKSI